jgi:hypothetical protein
LIVNSPFTIFPSTTPPPTAEVAELESEEEQAVNDKKPIATNKIDANFFIPKLN